MLYSEIVEKIRTGDMLDGSTINGVQLIMLLQDKELKSFQCDNTLYEINFILVSERDIIWEPIIEINDKTCSTFRQGCDVLFKIVDNYRRNLDSFIHMEDDHEYFKVIIDVLETKE